MKDIRFGEAFAMIACLSFLVLVAGCNPATALNDLQVYQLAIGGNGCNCSDNCSTTPVSQQGASGCQDVPGATVTIEGTTYPALCLCSCQSGWGGGALSCQWNPDNHIPKLQRLADLKLEVLEE